MFRTGLLISTAMTAVTLLLSGTPTGAYAQTDMHTASQDSNARFLCTYGQLKVLTNSSDGGFSYSSSSWSHVAVPVTGHGQTVRSIRVIEKVGYPSDSTSTHSFTVGIYSNSPRGLPGKPIAVGTGRSGLTCGPVTIPIAATSLKRNTKYWIEERALRHRLRCPEPLQADGEHRRRRHGPGLCSNSHSGPAIVDWFADPKTKRKAYVQNHRFSWYNSTNSSVSYTSPWKRQTTGPYLRLK